MDSVQVIPARDWAKGSDFPDLTAIYFFLAWPVFPASLGAFVTRLWILGEHEFIDRSVANFDSSSAFASFFIIALGLRVLWSMDGGKLLGVSIGTRLANLLVFD